MNIFFLLSFITLSILIILAQLHSPINFSELFSVPKITLYYRTRTNTAHTHKPPRRTYKLSISRLAIGIAILSIITFTGIATINYFFPVSDKIIIISKNQELSSQIELSLLPKEDEKFLKQIAKNAPSPQKAQNQELTITSILLFICMILGMLAKTLWDAIENRNSSSSVNIDLWNLVKPMLISPIIFGAVMAIQADNSPNSLPTYLLSFQNGFMWQTIFSKITK